MKVYVIEEEGAGHVKVGISEVPFRRLGYLQTACVNRLHLRYEHDAGDREAAHRIESGVHRLLAKQCVSGEWFAVSVAEAIEAINEAVAGRAPKAASKARTSKTKLVGFRLTQEELAMLHEAAAICGSQRKALVAGLRKLEEGTTELTDEELMAAVKERLG